MTLKYSSFFYFPIIYMSKVTGLCPAFNYCYHPEMPEVLRMIDVSSRDEFCEWAKSVDLCMCYVAPYFESEAKKAKMYYYLVTYTLKYPADYPAACDYINARIKLDYVKKTIQSTENRESNIHVHQLVYSTKAMQKSIDFKHYMNRFGFIDFRPVNPTQLQNVVDYISKQESPTTLVRPL